MNSSNYDNFSLRLFQVFQLFYPVEVNSVLEQPQWATKYPDVIGRWRSPDNLTSSRVLLPEEIMLSISRECTCIGDLYADPDGETLHIVTRGSKPFHWSSSGDQVTNEEIVGARHISVEEAFNIYGAEAVWLAQEYGKSHRGERDNRFRNLD